MALFLLYFVASSFRVTKKEFDRIVLLAILGGGAAALLSAYGFYSGTGFGQHAVRATLVVGDQKVNPNHFGASLLIPLSFATARVLSARHRLTRIFALFILAVISLQDYSSRVRVRSLLPRLLC